MFSAIAHAALLVGLGLFVVACLPGKRDNTPPPADVAVEDGEQLDGAAADGLSTDDVEADASVDSEEDTEPLLDTNEADTGPAQLPKGCSADSDCDELTVNTCVTSECNLGTGLCEQLPVTDGTACTLADPCVVDTTCDGGACTGKDKVCDDQNDCTEDSCVLFKGCRFLPVTKTCNDGNPCTLADECSATTCKGVVQDCAVLDPCKVGTCDPTNGECDYNGNAKSGTSCDDNSPCTTGDSCDGSGGCVGKDVNGAKLCDDKNPCTRDVCDVTKKDGCAHLPEAGPKTCTDGKPCTDDACKAGKCVSTEVVCDDGKPCTKDACKAAANGVDPTCAYTAMNSGSCLDAKPCAAEATCLKGVCTVGKNKTCNDGNVCTKDSCEPKAGGCLHLAQAGPCNDGSGCTKDDACKAGKCTGTAKNCSDGDPCTLDECDPVTAKCSNDLAPEGYVCGQNAVCKFGKCTVGG